MRHVLTTKNQHLGVGKRLPQLLALFCIIMIILLSSFSCQAQEAEQEDNQARDWSYYFQLPISLILIFILMVAMMVYVRRTE